MAGDGVWFGVLGPLLVVRDGQQITMPRSTVLRGLLGALLLAHGEPLPYDRLAGLIWTTPADRVGRNSIQAAASRLRAWLRDAGLQVTIEHAPGGYRLLVDRAAVDICRLQDQVDLAGQALDPARRYTLLTAALGMVRGPVLADLPTLDATDPVVRNAEEAVRTAALALAAAAKDTDQPASAVTPLQTLAAARPLDEPLHAALIEVLAASGQPSAALACYEDLRRRLAEELGVNPGEQVQKVHLAVLASDRELAISAADQRSSGGASPDHRVPMQLPADVADFTGRSAALRALEDLCVAAGEHPSAVVIMTLTGAAGVGKTALAVHWAHQVAPRFPDGQLYVNLHGHGPGPPLPPLRVLGHVLHALGVEAEQIPVDLESAAALYRSVLAGRRALVVLDNARDSEQVRPLLPGNPGCLVLVTSREDLAGLVATHGARRLTVAPLTRDEALRLLVRIAGSPRVTAEPDAAEQLIEVCGYLPLAVRIAAANLSSRPDQSIAGYLEELRHGDRLSGLAVDGDPQAAVRAAFDRSYEVLDPQERRLFRLLGMVPGPQFDAPAAAALLATTPQRSRWLLDRLAGAHLIEPRGSGRFGLHDLLRVYARDHAEHADRRSGSQDASAAVERLLTWYLQAADAADRLLYPERVRVPLPAPDPRLPRMAFGDHVEALAWLDTEHANLVAAVHHATEHGPAPLAWLLADVLRGWFWRRRHMIDWLAVAHDGLQAAAGAGDLQAQAAAQRNLGVAYQSAGDRTQAAEHYRRALDLAQQAGWVDGEVAALETLGFVHAQRGELEQAAGYYAQSLHLSQQIGSDGGQAIALGNLGELHRQIGNGQRAAEYLTQALALYSRIDSKGGRARALETLGEAEHDLGRLDHALEHLSAALDLHRAIGNRHGEAYDLRALAAVHRDAGGLSQALDLADAALALAREIGDSALEAEALNALGGVHLRQGRPRAAVDHHERALALVSRIGDRHPRAETLVDLAVAHRQNGEPTKSLACAEQALSLASRAHYRLLEGRAHTAIAGAHLALGDHAKAGVHAHQGLEIHAETAHRLGLAATLVVRGHVLRHTQGFDAAIPCWRDALALFTDIGCPDADHVRTLLNA